MNAMHPPFKTDTREDLIRLLSITAAADVEALRAAANQTLLDHCGTTVYFRGLIEFSNLCVNDCHYCGIRAGNSEVRRYQLTEDEIVATALWCGRHGYGSVVLQSGERRDERFVALVEAAVKRIKKESVSSLLPHGLGITLCVGEQSRETYARFFAAGAHRYLLRIESSNPHLFARIHPPRQQLASRIECLHTLKSVGFQVGTGVMIGLPGQTIENLADDILFFRDMDIDMIGMGPYIPHQQTPMAHWPDAAGMTPGQRLQLALTMIAVTRLTLPDINIAATTALQAIDPKGREEGLLFGANVIMPQATPQQFRHDYLLYEGKPCLDETADQCMACLSNRIRAVGREIGIDAWGDSRHALGRAAP
jgi:biotin synthase